MSVYGEWKRGQKNAKGQRAATLALASTTKGHYNMTKTLVLQKPIDTKVAISEDGFLYIIQKTPGGFNFHVKLTAEQIEEISAFSKNAIGGA